MVDFGALKGSLERLRRQELRNRSKRDGSFRRDKGEFRLPPVTASYVSSITAIPELV